MSCNKFRLSCQKKCPLPGQSTSDRWRISPNNSMTEFEVQNFLIRNPDVLESFILEYVSVETLDKIVKQKREEQSSTSYFQKKELGKLYQLESTRDIANAIGNAIGDTETYARLEEVTEIIAHAINAKSYSLYIPQHNEKELAIYRNGTLQPYGPVGKGQTVSAYAAQEKCPVLIDDLSADSRFPKGIGSSEENIGSVLCIPVILPSDDVIGIIELIRDQISSPFTKVDMQLSNALLGWVAACIHENSLKNIVNAQQQLNDFLLDTTKEMFDEMTCIDNVVKKILSFTKDLVNADRCSLFLVDEDKQELYADIFDEGVKDEEGKDVFTKKSMIRFGMEKGIAGYVANSGEVVNIIDAYKDSRFNHDIDKLTGFKTRNILCMPIMSKSKVVGVVQMINSLNGDHFTKADENAFKMYAVYCALALHYSQLYSLLHNQQTQYKVAMEVLKYHIICHEEELSAFEAKPFLEQDQIPLNLPLFDFCCYDYNEIIPNLFLHMIIDMFGNSRFELAKLCRFTLTVRKNYRNVTYHNWQHGFHVAHSLWCMLKSSPGVFSNFEKMAFVIAGICHDVDHRGYNNAYFQKMDMPLADLYSTSVMEQHHYRQTVTILQTEGQDIFSFLQATEYKEMLELIRHHIIATDLALYFTNQKILAKALEDNVYDIQDESLRRTTKALMMTGADLCAISKPWDTQGRTVTGLYNEFYLQGDEEKQKGFEPIPMMDRAKQEDIPNQQVGFIDFICAPLYRTLQKILPGTSPLIEGCMKSRDHWSKQVERRKSQLPSS